MLPPFIIEQIRKRESEEKAQHEQPRLELPLPMPHPGSRGPRDRGGNDRPRQEDGERGVIILEL